MLRPKDGVHLSIDRVVDQPLYHQSRQMFEGSEQISRVPESTLYQHAPLLDPDLVRITTAIR